MMNNALFTKIDSLSISSWNVHGLGQKHGDSYFLEHLRHDINILIETWKNNDVDIEITKFEKFYTFRKKIKKLKEIVEE